MHRTYEDFILFVLKNYVSNETPLLVPYKESFYSEIEYLTFIIKGNSFTCSNNFPLVEYQREILSVGDLKNCIDLGCDALRVRRSSIYEQFSPKKKISYSRYRDGVTSFGGIYVKDFILENDSLMFDTIF